MCKLSFQACFPGKCSELKINILYSDYSDAKNVDVYTGALSEPPLDGAIAGPVLNCLISDQFSRLKRGDSHWYERRTGPQRFTDGMLL